MRMRRARFTACNSGQALIETAPNETRYSSSGNTLSTAISLLL